MIWKYTKLNSTLLFYTKHMCVCSFPFLSHLRFTPEQLGITSSTALVWLIIEILLLLLIMYILNVTTDLKYLDLLAYCGYKYVGLVSSNNFVIVIWNQAHLKQMSSRMHLVFFYETFSVVRIRKFLLQRW